jgi:5-methylcytosine-specific restriction endonuclease McrA
MSTPHHSSQHQPTGQWIRKDKRLSIYLRDEFHCLYCGVNLKTAKPEDVTLDHLLPRSAGGSNDATNLVTACRSCNCSRQDRPWIDFAPGGARDRIEQRRHEALNLPLARALIAGTAGNPEVEAAR